ncbi:NosD domain-containing protein [Paracoccaceae bacterium Fryx2]|nr:NosD domain-containing protein [Paracoccaceae bacterium Fryx2]
MGNALAVLLLCGGVLLPAGAGAQQADYLARQRIEAAVARLSDPLAAGTLADDAASVMAGVGLAWNAAAAPAAAAKAFVPDTRAVIELVDIRLLLTQIAIQTGARDHLALVRAQGARDHDVILLRGGFATLADLPALSKGTPAQDFVTVTPDGIVLSRPLAIWTDAGLTLGPADQLILDRPSGSFVANLGWLDVQGGAIIGTDGPNAAEPAFRPFVLTAGQGGFTASDATLQALGFGASDVFGGMAVANNGLVAPLFSSAITDSALIDVATLGLIGTTGAVVSGNHIAAATGTAILISHARETVVAANRLTALSGSQAIRVTAGSADVRISGNLLSGTARTGILVDRDSRAVSVTGNLVAGSQTTGIGVEKARCVTITGNLVAGNGGTGITLTDTDDTTATGNAILFNRGSGVLVRDQAAAAQVWLTGNVLAGNRDGLRGATPGDVAVEGNDLDGQMPRVFAGDLAPLTVDWLRSRRDAVVSIPAPSPAPCDFQGNG